MVGLMTGLRTDSVSRNLSLVRGDDVGDPERRTAPPGNIADPHADLLSFLDEPQRKGMIALLAVGYYDGWRPSREEVADLVSSRTTDQARQPEFWGTRRLGAPTMSHIDPGPQFTHQLMTTG